MLATNHAFTDFSANADRACPASTGARAPVLHAVSRATHSQRPRYRVHRPRGRWLILGLLVAAHALGVWLVWNMAPGVQGPAPARSVEVALIAPREIPPPPPPRPIARPRPQDRSRPTLQPPPMMPPVAAPQAPAVLTVPIPLTPPPVDSPVTAVAAPVVVESTTPLAPAVPPPRAELTPPRFDAAYLDNPAPGYPAAARRAREEGRVLLRVLVSVQGRAQDVQLVQGSGSERLDEAAIDAVRRWRFVPARRGDEVVAAHVQVPLVFSLRR